MAKSKAESKQPENPMDNKIKYTEAINELEAIVSEIENDDISVDDLAKKVKRASLLIKICKDKLTRTENEVNEVLRELKMEDAETRDNQ